MNATRPRFASEIDLSDVGGVDIAAQDRDRRGCVSPEAATHLSQKIDEPLERILSDVDTLADRAAEHPEAITEKLDTD